MYSILIIDDDEKFRVMLRSMLERAGYDVVEAREGGEGIKVALGRHFHLAIVDLIMPEKEGIETIMEMRKNLSNLKIIAISGGGRGKPEGYLQTARVAGAHLAFTKPLDQEEILAAVKELILGVGIKTD